MLVYDIEIHNAIPDSRNPTEADIQYCEGWKDHQGMGIACICCYDYKADRYRVFCRDNLAEFAALVDAQECVVGFNNQRFDDLVLAAQGYEILAAKSYDLLQEIWRGLNLGSDFRPATHGGYSLEAMCRANFLTTKTGNGADAPLQWQRGKVGTVIDYCLNDVRLTRRLLDRVIRCGYLANPQQQGRVIPIRKPGAHHDRD